MKNFRRNSRCVKSLQICRVPKTPPAGLRMLTGGRGKYMLSSCWAELIIRHSQGRGPITNVVDACFSCEACLHFEARLTANPVSSLENACTTSCKLQLQLHSRLQEDVLKLNRDVRK